MADYTVTPEVLLNAPDSSGWWGTETYYLCRLNERTAIVEWEQPHNPQLRLLQALRYDPATGEIETGPKLVRRDSSAGDRIYGYERAYMRGLGNNVFAVLDPDANELEAYQVADNLEITALARRPTPLVPRDQNNFYQRAKGVRLVVWDDNTLLLLARLKFVSFNQTAGAHAVFARWANNDWVFGTVSESFDAGTASLFNSLIGSPDYVSVEKIDSNTAVALSGSNWDVEPYTDPDAYLLISGTYPAAPTIAFHRTTAWASGYNPEELFPRHDGQPGVLRVVAAEPGTTQPDTPSTWRMQDWRYMPLTLENGIVVEGEPVLVQAMVQTQQEIGWDMMIGSMENGDVLATATANNEGQSGPGGPGEVATWVVNNPVQYWTNSTVAYTSDWYRSATSTGKVHFGAWFTSAETETVHYGQLYVQAFALPFAMPAIEGGLVGTERRFTAGHHRA